MYKLAEMIIEDKAIEVAKKALMEGLSVDIIKNITDLEISTIQRLQTELSEAI